MAEQCGRSITCRACAGVAIPGKRAVRIAQEGMPVILPRFEVAEIRRWLACEKPQVLNFFPELTYAD
jgi:hypothetical protein